MKITRYKKVQKYLKFYYNNYGFRQPYQVLIDGTFCFAAFKEQVNIRDQLPKYLNGQAKLLTTRCIIIETEKVAKKTHGALTILKQFGIHECGHKEPIPGNKCISTMISKGNEKHYIVASQDRDLQERLRKKAGVPILYLHNKSPTLEKPSKPSYDKVNPTIEANAPTFISNTQNEMLKKMKKALGVEEEEKEQPKIMPKKKKHKNPNPLSCKKKKKKPAGRGDRPNGPKGVNENGKIKKQDRNKSKHFKDTLANAAAATNSQ